jgi:alpha-galactosidase
MSSGPVTNTTVKSDVFAACIDQEIVIDAAHPSTAWSNAEPVIFFSDWQGKNPDPERQTQVQLLWSTESLYLRFECRYRELFVFEDSEPNGRRDRLWERDVAEVFLQPPEPGLGHYKEFEVSSNGMWVDLDIFPGGRSDLNSGLRRSAVLDETRRMWCAELAIPFRDMTSNFDPNRTWRVNFFRIEGQAEPRAYHAWRPTHTPQPNFHVPQAFGRLHFEPALRK